MSESRKYYSTARVLFARRESYSVAPWRVRLVETDMELASCDRLREAREFMRVVDPLVVGVSSLPLRGGDAEIAKQAWLKTKGAQLMRAAEDSLRQIMEPGGGV